MPRVFLDQWCWTHLEQSAHGTRADKALAEVLDFLRYGSTAGLLSLPVASEHYIDTYRYENVEARRRRGQLMHELSRSHTMCPITTALRAEIDLALRATFGRPEYATPPRVFGVGVSHAFAEPELRLHLDPSKFEDAGLRSFLEAQWSGFMEQEMLGGPPFSLPAEGIARPDNQVDQKWADARNERQRRMAEWGISEDRTWRAALACQYADLLEMLYERAERASVPINQLFEEGDPARLTAFLELIPTAYMFACVDDVALRNSNHRWEAGDFHDVLMLSLAATYCDVVVVDRRWSNFFNRSRAPRHAVVTNRLAELPELVLARQTAPAS
jgi:hypothetical protein